MYKLIPQSVWQFPLLVVSSLLIGGFFILGAAQLAHADSLSVDFENPPYTTGTIHLQDGWSSFGAAGSGCAVYDHAVDSSFSTPTFGDQSLRISNAVTSGCFGDQTFSKSLADEAGETASQPSGSYHVGGTKQTHFEAQFDIKSKTGVQQAGLFMSTSADRGDGARMSYVGFDDQADGIHVIFFDYQDAVPFGTLPSPADGCAAEDDFIQADIATIDRTFLHTIKLVIDFVNGPRNDIVKVYVDGVLKKTGTTWEDYFRWCTESGGGVPNDATADVSRAVDSLLFRTGGAAAPANAGNGYLVDNLSLLSSTPAPGTISGFKWNDINGNGTKGSSEPFLQGWTIYIDLNNNGVKNSGEPSATTNSSGNYTLPQQQPGTYTIREVMQSDWVVSTPSTGFHTVTVNGNQTGKNFGNKMSPNYDPDPNDACGPTTAKVVVGGEGWYYCDSINTVGACPGGTTKVWTDQSQGYYYCQAGGA